MFAKRFFFVCAGLLCLAIAYHLGARSAGAQTPGNTVVASRADGYVVYTSNGDVYFSVGAGPENGGRWTWVGNVFSSAPVSTQSETWGQLKTRYRTGRER